LSKRLYDVVVIGAGVFGVWIAYHLRESRNRVLLVDAFGAGNSRSSSGDESRVIRVGYGADELYTRSAVHSLQKWLEILEHRKCDHLFQRTGSLSMGKKNDPYLRNTARVLKRTGVKMEEFSGDELNKRYPQFNPEGIEWATLEPQSGAILARHAVRAVLDAYIEKGGDYTIVRVSPPGQVQNLSSVITADGDEISAAVFIFACGPWLAKMFPKLLGKRLFVTRQEVFYFGSSNGTQYKPERMPVWCHQDDHCYGLPDLDGRGVKAVPDYYGPPFDPDADDRLVSNEGLVQMRTYLTRRVPGLAHARVVETRVCQYENTSNGDFLLDRHPEADNVWLAGGGSGHGFKHGPAVGEYLSGQIDGMGKAEPRFSLRSKGTTQNRTVF